MRFRSALYVGAVTHRRLWPRVHKFRYRAFWLLIDLDELPDLASRLHLFSRNGFNFFGLRETDHGDGSATPLHLQTERHLAEAGIDIAGGVIRLFCMPRTLGYCFNPLSVYFCHHADGSLAALLYEVHNTFGQRHSYVIPVAEESIGIHQRCQKMFYVSPFMDMDMRYEFRVTGPAEHISVAIRASTAGTPVLTACLAGARRELSDQALMRLFLTIPAVTLKVVLAIHWEALRLWLKGLRLRHRPAPPERIVAVAPSRSRNTD